MGKDTRPEIWKKYDKIIESGDYLLIERHNIIPISDKTWMEHVRALLPTTKASIQAYGHAHITIDGKDIPCMAYKNSYAVVKKKDLNL